MHPRLTPALVGQAAELIELAHQCKWRRMLAGSRLACSIMLCSMQILHDASKAGQLRLQRRVLQAHGTCRPERPLALRSTPGWSLQDNIVLLY